jgi:hypothetical protein
MKNYFLFFIFTAVFSSCGLFDKKDDPQPAVPPIAVVNDDLKAFKDASDQNFIEYQMNFIADPLNDSMYKEKHVGKDSEVWVGTDANGGFISYYLQGTVDPTLPPDSLLPHFLPDVLWQPLIDNYNGYHKTFVSDYHTDGIGVDSATASFNSKCIADIRKIDNNRADEWIAEYFRLGYFENQSYSIEEMACIKEIASRHQKK